MTMILALALVFGQERGGKIEWRKDVEPSFAEARRSAKPLLVYFTDDG